MKSIKKSFIAVTICLLAISCQKDETFSNTNASTTKSNQNTTLAETSSPTTIGVEKGKRKLCPQGSDKICCGYKFCIVTPLSDYEPGASVDIPNYFQGTIEKVDDDKLKITMPFNKISFSTYSNWFINNTYDAEYFPLSEAIASNMGLSNIAISEGIYAVDSVIDVGYVIFVDYQDQIDE
ncbi:MAG: hypothetical protein KBE91_09525 [Bacteroidia bacterium]|nr:hypothetical protein [Bacteroidia bacterium]MBP9689838.1 hypothetical protein [Bacteroidia bacterium]